MKRVGILATITVAFLGALPSSLAAGTLYDFNSYNDGDILGDGATIQMGEVVKTFGEPIGNQVAPQVTQISATNVTPLGGSGLSATFTTSWGLSPQPAPFAGIMMVNPMTDLSTQNFATIDVRATGPGTVTVALLINDGTTSYEHNSTTILAGDNNYNFGFNTPGDWTFTDGNVATTYAQVLANSQFLGFTLARAAPTSDINTITFDNLVVVPEPASISLIAFGVLLLRKRRPTSSPV
jgi:hypothetical protein